MFKLFTLFSVPVYAHWSFLFMLFMIVPSGLMYAAALLLSLLLHEFGHVLVARVIGYRTQQVVFEALGAGAYIEDSQGTDTIKIIAAGPIVNVMIAGCLTLAMMLMGSMHLNYDAVLLMKVITLNLALAIFNMMPIFPLDGGRILHAILSFWHSSYESLEITLKVTVVTTALLFVAFLTIFPSIVAALIVALFGYNAVSQLRRS